MRASLVASCLVLLTLGYGCATLSSIRAVNRTNLLRLSVGMTKEAALQTMGEQTLQAWTFPFLFEPINNPFRTETMNIKNGGTALILFYYTDKHMDDDNDTEAEPCRIRHDHRFSAGVGVCSLHVRAGVD